MFNKREVVIWFIKHDLLGIQEHAALMDRLLGADEKVTESALRLANALGDDYMGREYFENEQMIDFLIALFKRLSQSEANAGMKRVVISLIQKLSLRKLPQIKMISSGIIEMLIQMSEQAEGSAFEDIIEYSMALLMNLSLHSEGKLRCLHLSTKILNLLTSLVRHPTEGVKTHVNGIFYSLFEIREFREEAKAMGIRELLKELHTAHHDPLYQKQILYILDKLDNEQRDYEPSEDYSNNDIDELDD